MVLLNAVLNLFNLVFLGLLLIDLLELAGIVKYKMFHIFVFLKILGDFYKPYSLFTLCKAKSFLSHRGSVSAYKNIT